MPVVDRNGATFSATINGKFQSIPYRLQIRFNVPLYLRFARIAPRSSEVVHAKQPKTIVQAPTISPSPTTTCDLRVCIENS